MATTLWVEISLASQGLSGVEALEMRNALEDQVEESGVGEIVGAGCAVDGSSCDFQVLTDDPDAAEEFLRGLLEHVELLEATTIRRDDGDSP